MVRQLLDLLPFAKFEKPLNKASLAYHLKPLFHSHDWYATQAQPFLRWPLFSPLSIAIELIKQNKGTASGRRAFSCFILPAMPSL
jgi:hypothetical protein